MDTTTHALAGYMIAKTGLARGTGKWGTIAGVSAAVLPDMDLVLRPLFSTEFTLKYHRHLTNSVFLIVPVSLLFAWLFVRISGVRRFWTFFFICIVELLAHTFLDLATSYGTMILSPFSDYRFALDWVFIIDLLLVSAFLFPLIALHIWKRREQTLARVSVAIAVLYISLCAYNHWWALSLAKSYAQQRGELHPHREENPPGIRRPHWSKPRGEFLEPLLARLSARLATPIPGMGEVR
jgi:inner membrane protein